MGEVLLVRMLLLLCAVLLWHVPRGFAEQIHLEEVLAETRLHAIDLRIAQYNLLAATAQVAETRSDYYPQLSLRFGNEYVRVHDADNNIVSVGDAIIADSASGYKHSLILSAHHTLYDFGRRALGLRHALGQQRIAEEQHTKVWWEIRRQVVDLYARALKQQKMRVAQRHRNAAAQEIYRLSERLHSAGRHGREAVASAALQLADAAIALQDLETEFANSLDALSSFTGRIYPATTSLADLPVMNVERVFFDSGHHPDILLAQLEMDQKALELRLARRNRYPHIVLSASHRMFGSDPQRFHESLTSLTARDSRITLYVEVPLFSGFRSLARTARLQHELAALQLRKQKVVEDISTELKQRQRLFQSLSQQESMRRERQGSIDQQLQDLTRLTQEQMIDGIAAWQKNIELSQHQMEVDLRQVDLATQSLLLWHMSEAEQCSRL